MKMGAYLLRSRKEYSIEGPKIESNRASIPIEVSDLT